MKSKKIRIPVEPKKFLFGKHTFDNGRSFIEEEQFNIAVELLNNAKLEEKIPLIASQDMVPYLNTELANIVMNSPIIGRVLKYDKEGNYIEVETNPNIPTYRLLVEYGKALTDGDAIADIGFFGSYEDVGTVKRLDIKGIQVFTLFIKKEVLVESAMYAGEKDYEQIKVPMFITRDENDVYTSPNGYFYTKKTLLDAYSKAETLQKMLKDKSCPMIVGNPDFESGSIPIDQILGFVYEYNIEEGYIMVNVNRASIHGKMLLNNKNLIGDELFAGMLMIGDNVKSKIAMADGTYPDTKEMIIHNIFGFQLVRKKKSIKEEQ
jgi:hypothetical protein